MKNDELFDMLTELKVDDEYVDEALTGNSDSRGIKVYAGKTKPVKIIAPIAACLAVFTAAGVLFANRDKLPIINGALSPASSGESSLTDDEILDQIREDFKNRPSYIDIENSNAEKYELTDKPTTDVWGWAIPSQTKYVDVCKNLVTNMYANDLQGDVTWQVGDIDIDYDQTCDLVLCPQINGKSVKGVGVCVFKKLNAETDPVYVGSFGAEFDTMDLDRFYLITNYNNKDFYYYNCIEEDERCIDDLQWLGFDSNTNTVREESCLRLVKTYPRNASSNTEYTETAYSYGVETDISKFKDAWRKINRLTNDRVPFPNISADAHLANEECVQLLIDKYNVPANAASLHHTVQKTDINFDGEPETVIEFRNCELLRGIYVFSHDNKLIGELDLKGEHGGSVAVGNYTNTIGMVFDNGIHKYDKDGETFYYFITHRGKEEFYDDGCTHEWAECEVNMIVINEDGTLSTEKILEANYGSKIFKIKGKEVSEEEYDSEVTKFPNKGSMIFVW